MGEKEAHEGEGIHSHGPVSAQGIPHAQCQLCRVRGTEPGMVILCTHAYMYIYAG